MSQIPLAAVARFQELEAEDRDVRRVAQVGTSIPQLFAQADTFVSNPSSVGTGILSRMIETDDTVSASVQFKILMVLAKIGEYHHEDKRIADFVNDFLSKLKRPTWSATLESILSGGAYGFSLSEIVWGLNKKLQKVPIRISTYHPSTIAFEVDQYGLVTENGVIQFVMQQTQWANPSSRTAAIRYGWEQRNPFTTPYDRIMPWRMPFIYQYGLVRIPRANCIHYVNLPMLSFGSPYGKTAVRTAHLAWQLKQFFLRQLGIAGKRQATPMIHGQAPQGGIQVEVTLPDGSKKQVSPTEAMRLMLAGRETDDSVVTGPESAGYKITAIAAAADLNQVVAVINALNVWMFRCFLLPSLVMTDGSAGSRSLGDKHFEIVDKIADSDAEKVCETIVNDLIEPAIIFAFGEQDDYGSFTKRPQSSEERERLANVFGTLVDHGVMKPHVKVDMTFMRKSLNLPEDTDKSFDVDIPGEGDPEVAKAPGKGEGDDE